MARTSSTKILPLCSSVIIFLREAISTITCGGIVKKDPPAAPLSIGTTAKPFFTFLRILLYAVTNRSSIKCLYFSDFSFKASSSFSVSARIVSNSAFLCFK